MKILHVNDHYARVGGAETILFHTLSALAEHGVENVVVHQHPSPVPESRWRTYELPGLGDQQFSGPASAVGAFEALVTRERPDLVHLHDVGNPDIADTSLRFAPTVQSVLNHSFYCPGGMKYLPFLGRICERPFGAGCLASAFLTHCNSIRPSVLYASYRRSDHLMRRLRALTFVTLSQYQADRLRQSGIASERIARLPPYTELPALDDIPAGTDPPTVLYTGRVVAGKGLDLLLRALTRVRAPCRLLVVGDGPALPTIRQLARRLGLERRVTFAGWVSREQQPIYYRQAAVVVVPSVWPEPFGMVGIEAMSYGKPVVAFRVGGIPEWLDDEVTGFLVEPGHVQGPAARITYLLEHPAEARAMGRRGRQKVEQTFCKTVYLTGLLKVYEDAQRAWRPREVLPS